MAARLRPAMRTAIPLLVFALSGCLFFDEPGLGDDDDDGDPSERIDCFADLPDEVASERLPGACERTVDLGPDGTTDSTATFRYDDAGRRMSSRVDETLLTFAYDEAGNLELTEIDFYIDGDIDSRETREYSCFEGEELPDPLPGPCSITSDTNADGTADFVRTFDYEDGVLIGERNELGGKVVSIVVHDHDDAGRLAMTTTDTLGDGRIDHSVQFGYDDDGHLRYQRSDEMADGTIDHVLEYTLDGEGRRSVVEEFARDRLTSTVRYGYDEEGRVILETTTYPGTAGAHVIERRYDPAGNLLAEAEYDELDWRYSECRRYEYDCF
jgi:hypothetical protein